MGDSPTAQVKHNASNTCDARSSGSKQSLKRCRYQPAEIRDIAANEQFVKLPHTWEKKDGNEQIDDLRGLYKSIMTGEAKRVTGMNIRVECKSVIAHRCRVLERFDRLDSYVISFNTEDQGRKAVDFLRNTRDATASKGSYLRKDGTEMGAAIIPGKSKCRCNISICTISDDLLNNLFKVQSIFWWEHGRDYEDDRNVPKDEQPDPRAFS
ncbi:hypothetical protein BYT27DRAFT_6457386 [Phlegmacium glaucopus]|nr:hypothetical protein BYT27DRAFT_6457386 [Phlegmacium glaucopus]